MLIDYIDLKTANVYGIYGLLGGGKTLTAVELSLEFLKRGFAVSSNIELKNISKEYTENYHFYPDINDVDFWTLPTGAPRGTKSNYRTAVVVDECAEFFDQFSSSSLQIKRFLSWLRHSSKRGQFVFLIVQRPEFIAKSLRLLINKWICCVDLYQFRLPILKIKIPFCSSFVMRKVVDKMGNILSRGFALANKRDIGFFYDTSQSIALAGRDISHGDNENVKKPMQYQLSMAFFVTAYIIILFLVF